MKESKLDGYRDFIAKKLQADTSISQLRRDLAKEGCEVSYSALTEWIEKSLVGQGVAIPERKRGRPRKLKPTMFGILPSEDSPDQASIQIPMFLWALQYIHGRPRMEARILALAEVEVLSTPLTPLSYWSVAPESLATLSDLEICLLAYISSDLPPPPLEKSNDEYGAWLKELIVRACKLRAEIREACAK